MQLHKIEIMNFWPLTTKYHFPFFYIKFTLETFC